METPFAVAAQNAGFECKHNNPVRRDGNFESMYRTFESCRPSLVFFMSGKVNMESSPKQYVTPVTWLAAPGWLTPQQAAALTGHSLEDIQRIMAEGAVELGQDSDQVLIEKDSLYEFQETLVELSHWDE